MYVSEKSDAAETAELIPSRAVPRFDEIIIVDAIDDTNEKTFC